MLTTFLLSAFNKTHQQEAKKKERNIFRDFVTADATAEILWLSKWLLYRFCHFTKWYMRCSKWIDDLYDWVINSKKIFSKGECGWSLASLTTFLTHSYKFCTQLFVSLSTQAQASVAGWLGRKAYCVSAEVALSPGRLEKQCIEARVVWPSRMFGSIAQIMFLFKYCLIAVFSARVP